MANWSYLYMSDSAEHFVSTIPEYQILAAGRYVIPIFWFTAFATDDIYEAIYDMEENETGNAAEVPMAALRATKDVALMRALARRDSCFRILPDSLQPIYDQWLALVRGMELPHLHINAEEIWMMGHKMLGAAACCTDGRSADWWPLHQVERRDRCRPDTPTLVQHVSTHYNDGA